MNAEERLPFKPWRSAAGRLLPFEVRLQGTGQAVTINPDRIAYITPGSDPALTTSVHFGCGQPLEIVCPYDALTPFLQGTYGLTEE